MVRALASVFILVVLTAVAHAQQPDPAGARLFEEGRELAKNGNYVEACDKFSQSLAIDPAIGTQLNYADCHEKMNHNAEAWRQFDAAADAEKTTNPERAKFSRSRADALLPKIGVIVLKVSSPDAAGLTISIAGRTVKPAAVIREIVDLGEVAISVTAANAAPFEHTEKVVAGKTASVEVPALAALDTGGGGGVSEPDETGGRRRSRVLLAYGVGGVGAVAMITGIVLGLKANSDYHAQFEGTAPNCQDISPPMCNQTGLDAQNNAITLAHVGTGLSVAGVALIGAGAVLFLTAPRDVVVTPTATAQSAGISVVGNF